MRDIQVVLSRVIDLLPEDVAADAVKEDLRRISRESNIVAPELMSFKWGDAHEILCAYFFVDSPQYIDEAKEEVGIKVFKEFSGQSEYYIRQHVIRPKED